MPKIRIPHVVCWCHSLTSSFKRSLTCLKSTWLLCEKGHSRLQTLSNFRTRLVEADYKKWNYCNFVWVTQASLKHKAQENKWLGNPHCQIRSVNSKAEELLKGTQNFFTAALSHISSETISNCHAQNYCMCILTKDGLNFYIWNLKRRPKILNCMIFG